MCFFVNDSQIWRNKYVCVSSRGISDILHTHLRVAYICSVTSTFNFTSKLLLQKLLPLSDTNGWNSGPLLLFMQMTTQGSMSTNPGHMVMLAFHT